MCVISHLYFTHTHPLTYSIAHLFVSLIFTFKVRQEMGVPAHHGPIMWPECLVRVCVCALQCPALETKRVGEYLCVCVCLGFSIVGGLDAGASVFPRYGVSVGVALAGLTATKSQSFPPDMQMSLGWAWPRASHTAAFNAFSARLEVTDVLRLSVLVLQRKNNFSFWLIVDLCSFSVSTATWGRLKTLRISKIVCYWPLWPPVHVP